MNVTKFIDLIFILLKKFCWQKLIDSRVGGVSLDFEVRTWGDGIIPTVTTNK